MVGYRAAGVRGALRLPEGVMQTLEALVMEPRQLAAELSKLDAEEGKAVSSQTNSVLKIFGLLHRFWKLSFMFLRRP